MLPAHPPFRASGPLPVSGATRAMLLAGQLLVRDELFAKSGQCFENEAHHVHKAAKYSEIRYQCFIIRSI